MRWLVALARPEAEYQSNAALAIAQAHQDGLKGLEATVPALLQVLERPRPQPSVRLAVVRALIALDARQKAARLLQQAQQGENDLRDLIDPALANWHFEPAGVMWLERFNQRDVAPGSLVLAMRGLAVLREEKAVPKLRDLALSPHAPIPLRLEAARALGDIRTSGSEADARGLMSDSSPQGIANRLFAVALLRHHKGDEAVRLLQDLARDPEPAVDTEALAQLVALDPHLAVPVLAHALASSDANVRSYGVEVLSRLPTRDHLRLLADRLDDPHPAVRTKARRSLWELAVKPEHREAIIAETTRVLEGESWRGQEQAIFLLVGLGHKPTTHRLQELLNAPRPEVFITAAWGLRRLAVAETLPAVRAYVHQRYEQLLNAPAARPSSLAQAVDLQLAQLIQFFGQSRYRAADGELRPLLPRRLPPAGNFNPPGQTARAAAVWALGLFHAGQPEPSLVAAFEARMRDVSMRDSEWPIVRQMAAVGLGRMKATQAVATLRRFTNRQQMFAGPVSDACQWAIAQITGEPAQTPPVVKNYLSRWFLIPTAEAALSNQNAAAESAPKPFGR
jgi:HEAT repeat protein